MTIFALLLFSFMTSADSMVLMPIIDLLSTQVFPEYSYATVSLISQASALALAIISVVSGALIRFGEKRLIIVGTLLFSIGGVSGSFITNLYYIIFTRLFEGFGAGLVMTVSLMMIPELFREQKQVDKIMGYNGVIMAVFSGVLTFTSGYLAMVSWKLPFAYYAVGFVILAFQIAYIPSDRKEDVDGHESTMARSRVTREGVMHALGGLMFGISSSFFFVCLSGVLAENNIGDATIAGTASTFNTIGSFVSGFLFAMVFGKLKNYSFTVFYAIMIAAWAIILDAGSSTVVFAAAVVNGFAWNWFFTGYLAKASIISDESSTEANMGLAKGCFYLGMFITPFAMTAISAITGNASTVFAMRAALYIMVVLALIHLISAFVSGRKKAGFTVLTPAIFGLSCGNFSATVHSTAAKRFAAAFVHLHFFHF